MDDTKSFIWCKNYKKHTDKSTEIYIYIYIYIYYIILYSLYYFEINNPYGSKLLTRFRLGLSHLRESNLDTTFKTVLIQYVSLV